MPSEQNLPQLTNAAGCLDKTGVGEGPDEEIMECQETGPAAVAVCTTRTNTEVGKVGIGL
jgi:hypothetical protein